jgi:hypothetical protein
MRSARVAEPGSAGRREPEAAQTRQIAHPSTRDRGINHLALADSRIVERPSAHVTRLAIDMAGQPDLVGEHQPKAPPEGWLRAQLSAKQATHGVYVEIVVLAVIIALEGKRASDADVILSLLGAIVAVLLAELYAYYVGAMIGTGRRPTSGELRAAVADSVSSLIAIAPSVLLVVLGVAGVIDLGKAFVAATWVGVGVIALYALLAHRRTGLSTRRSVPLAVLLALIGLGLVLLKQYFH